VKGYQKKVIYLKNTGSQIFDEAVFFVSRECEEQRLENSDMVIEASRIIDECLGKENSRGRDEKKGFFAFLPPFLVGVFVCSLAVLFCRFLILFDRLYRKRAFCNYENINLK
jgi:hypothetical protein